MRKTILIFLSLFLVISISWYVYTSILRPSTSPVVITGRTIIDQSGTYILTNDISCTELVGEDTCINIFGSNIVLDCQNHVVLGPGERSMTIGIGISPRDEYVTIKNCNVQKFYIGIRTAHNGLNSIINNIVSNNTDIGIYLDNARDHTLINNTANYNSKGIYLFLESNYNILINNTANNNDFFGFYLIQSSHNNTLIDNQACGNALDYFPALGERKEAGDVFCSNSTMVDEGGNICNPVGPNCGGTINCNAGCH